MQFKKLSKLLKKEDNDNHQKKVICSDLNPIIIVLYPCLAVVGPRYIEDDLTVRYVGRLEHDASGVVGKYNWLDQCRPNTKSSIINGVFLSTFHHFGL